MTEEQIIKGQQLIKELEKNKQYLKNWQRATSYNDNISFTYATNCSIYDDTTPHVIPFEEYKSRATYYFQKKVDELQTEFDNL